MSTVAVALFILISILVTLFLFLYRVWGPHNYWRKKRIADPKPIPILGNYASVIFGFKTEAELLRSIYEEYSDDFVGIYKGIHPVLLVKNPDFIKQVLIKDFDSFNTRCIEKPLRIYNKSLFIMKGDEEWKTWRKIFSSGMLSDKIQIMIPLVKKSLKKYVKYIDNLQDNYTHFEIRDLQKKYMFDVFSKLIYNKDREVFTPNDKFENVAAHFIDSKLRMSLSHVLELISPPKVFSILNAVQLKSDEFNSIQNYIVNHIHGVESQGAKRNNLVEFLISKKTAKQGEEKGNEKIGKDLFTNIDDDIILQQSLTFFLTAFDSTSSVSSFILYELAKNQDIQDKCVEEIRQVFGNNEDYSFESLTKLKYLQMVMDETMRKHTLAQALDRKCISKYTFPGTELTVDKGVYVFVPVHGLHNDPKYFPNPEEFNPNRFSEKNKVHIPQCVYVPFGDGPRTCIGQRLARIVILIGISGLLRRYKLSPSIKTNNKMKYDPRRVRNLAPLCGIWLVIEKRS